jgi:hypothetical protein
MQRLISAAILRTSSTPTTLCASTARISLPRLDVGIYEDIDSIEPSRDVALHAVLFDFTLVIDERRFDCFHGCILEDLTETREPRFVRCGGLASIFAAPASSATTRFAKYDNFIIVFVVVIELCSNRPFDNRLNARFLVNRLRIASTSRTSRCLLP